jgi:hypothetical protein
MCNRPDWGWISGFGQPQRASQVIHQAKYSERAPRTTAATGRAGRPTPKSGGPLGTARLR